MDSPHDPHDVVPPDFCENWGKETIPEALAVAEAAPSTTDESERPNCSRCGSLQVERVHNKKDTPNQKPGRFRCIKQGCYHHFDTPAGENTIFATADRAEPFDWLELDELTAADERTSLTERREGEPDDGAAEKRLNRTTATA